MKFLTRITDSYKKVVVTLGLVITTNPLMAVSNPATGITETRSLVVQIISVLAIVGGCTPFVYNQSYHLIKVKITQFSKRSLKLPLLRC
uniref:CagC protein n=1 Tax=Helicobacter pylori TaxID=210 RepID=E0WII3_HELPX|nr:CagC protein [Helicobacter pylori]